MCPLLCSGHGVYAGGQCHCVDGWKGRECEVVETECLDPSCNGHGRCREGVCICASGWTGDSCETSKSISNCLNYLELQVILLRNKNKLLLK